MTGVATRPAHLARKRTPRPPAHRIGARARREAPPAAAEAASAAGKAAPAAPAGRAAPPGGETPTISQMFGHDSLYMVVLALQMVVTVILVPVMTRLLGPAGYGGVATAVALSQAIFPAAALGLQVGIQRIYAGEHGPEAARGLLTVSMVLAGAVSVLLYLAGPWWARAVGLGTFSPLLRLTVVWTGLSAVTYANLALLRSLDRLRSYAVVSLLQSVGIQFLALAAVLIGGRTPTMFVAGYAVGQAVALATGLVMAKPRLRGLTATRVTVAALAFSLPLVPQQICTFVLNACDRLVVHHFLGAAATGRYQVAWNVGGLVIILLTFLNQVWMPRVFALAPGDRAAVLSETRDRVYDLLVPVIVGMAVGVPAVLRIWAPASYHTATLVPVTVLVIATAVPYAASLGPTRILLSAGRTRELAAAAIVAAIINIGLNMVLVPRMGLTGSPAATLVSYVVLAAVAWALSRRTMHLSRVPATVIVRLGIALALAAATTPVATAGPWFALRLAAAVICLAWLGRDVLTLTRSDGAMGSLAGVSGS